ncbi:hypothetical protein [Alicyclobacillus ferrooxydans]|uniref:Uncharacterized protein n=1 Tax=Alicyclobacillus ferrooxydans TaxID=471514 RepID=A0A0P9CAT8_9BACL|nr:hypothetical protein [Alicyclobacillus ferrooxydans]KPV42558.1 hypothetical protein AN477_17135 [Alicyclobacillus ferrooxydans]
MDYEKLVCADGTLNYAECFKAECLNPFQNRNKPVSYRVFIDETNTIIFKSFAAKESLAQELCVESNLATDVLLDNPSCDFTTETSPEIRNTVLELSLVE